MDRWNDELESLFAKYKAAVPDPDASANFMPELWQKIEARQSLMVRLKKLTQVFVAAAAALCLLFGMVLAVPRSGNTELAGSYVDILAQSNPPDSLAVVGIVSHEASDIQ
jgi:hypothetical protein